MTLIKLTKPCASPSLLKTIEEDAEDYCGSKDYGDFCKAYASDFGDDGLTALKYEHMKKDGLIVLKFWIDEDGPKSCWALDDTKFETVWDMVIYIENKMDTKYLRKYPLDYEWVEKF